jgi:hypothetical protein
MADPVTFYSRYKNYKLAGAPSIGTIDFSGGKTPPAVGDGFYVSTDAAVIAWLRANGAYGIDFKETVFAPPPDPGVTPPDSRDAILNLFIDSIEYV